MMEIKERVQWQTTSGEAVAVGDITVIPQSQALTVHLPFGGFVWNRPTAVVVERDGRAERIPIYDVTRVLQLGLLGLSLVFAFAPWIKSARRKES